MPSTFALTSCTVFAAISYLTMSSPLPQTPSNMAYNPSMTGQGMGAPGTGTRSMDPAMGATGMNPAGSGMGTHAGGNGSTPMQPSSTQPKGQPGVYTDGGAMSGGPRPVGSMPPAPRPMAGGMDKNHTNTTSGANEMGYSGTGTTEPYGSVPNNSTMPPTVHPTATASFASVGTYWLEASGAAIALMLFA